MKKKEINATPDAIENSLTNNRYNRNPQLFRLYKLLTNITGNCSLAIDAPWGSGKTFFVKEEDKLIKEMYSATVKGNQESIRFIKKIDWGSMEFNTSGIDELLAMDAKEAMQTLYFDAWENDDEDPLTSLMFKILIENGGYDVGKAIEKVNKISKFLIKHSSNSIVNVTSDLLNMVDEIYTTEELKNTIKNELDELIKEKCNKLVIFIDELDRCKPEYAVKLLERTKHYLNHERVIVVYSVNILELQHTVKKYYGNEFDACGYICKLFDLRIDLSEIDVGSIFKDVNGKSSDMLYMKVAEECANRYAMSIRDIQQYLFLLEIVCGKKLEKNDYSFFVNKSLYIPVVFVLPILVAAYIKDLNGYEEIKKGTNGELISDVLATLNDNVLNKEIQTSSIQDEIDERKRDYRSFYNVLFNTKMVDGKKYKIGDLVLEKESRDILDEALTLLSDINLYQ